MNYWSRFPFVRLIIPLIAGIITALVFPDFSFLPIWIAVVTFALYLPLELVFRKKITYRFRKIYGWLIFIILYICGYWLTIINTPYLRHDNVSRFDEAEYFAVIVSEPVAERANSFKVVANVKGVSDSTTWRKASGKIILYFEKSDEVQLIEYGDEMIVRSDIQPVDPPKNPGEFDYRRYLRFKGIYNRGYVKAGEWKVTGKGYGNPVKETGTKLREVFLEILRENRLEGKEYAVVSAILLGYDEHLDPEQKRHFAGAGAMHILCVSGLHVGIIYVILNSLLGFLDRKRWMRLLRVFLLLMLIWFYAAITGFSPSVQRASTMFSFIIIGRTMRRKADIFNMIAASAFVLLVINPYILTEIGFQLSYLAVTGIVLLYKPIYQLFTPDNYLADKVWQISVVSIAATLFTFPVTVYYFNQFPVLFLLTNLVAIPASMLIIYLGLSVLITSFIPLVSKLIAWLLVWVIKILNFSVQWIEGLSFATWRGVHISNPELFLLSLLVISLAIILLTKRKYILPLMLGSMVLLLVSISFRSYRNMTQAKIVVYNVSKSTGIDFIRGKEAYFLADSSLVKDRSKIDYNISGFRTQSGVRNAELINFEDTLVRGTGFLKKQDMLCFGNKRLMHLKPGCRFTPGSKTLHVNYILLSGNPDIDISEITNVIQFDQIIFDASNAWNRLEKWKRECEEMKLDSFDVAENGAWIVSL